MHRPVSLPLLLIAACAAQEPVNGKHGDRPDAGLPDAAPLQGVPLQVEGLAPQTYWDSVPVFGRGPARGSVVVEGNNDARISAELGVDGSFCIDIPLEKGASNDLRIFALDEGGERSDPQSFQVEQSGHPPPPGEPTPAKNLALGGLPTSDSTMQEQDGFYNAITDGNRNTSMIMQNAVTLDDWITLRIPSPDSAISIRVYSNTDCEIGNYLIHTAENIPAQMPAPGLVNEDVPPWTFRGQAGTPNGSGDTGVTDCGTAGGLVCHEFAFDASVVGAVGISFVDTPCSNLFGLGEHSVNEIEVWKPQGITPPGEAAPSCQGGL